jgi:hypothetical protein
MEAAAAANKQQRLPPLIDCWLQLMQQQLLQPLPVGCPHAAAKGAVTGVQQQLGKPSQQQQQPQGLLVQTAATICLLSPDSSAAQQLLSAARCSCVRDTSDSDRLDEHGSSSSIRSSRISSVRMRCDSLDAVGGLLACLTAMQVTGRGWSDGRLHIVCMGACTTSSSPPLATVVLVPPVQCTSSIACRHSCHTWFS